MPSLEHDGVVELFRDNPHLGPHVLERFWHAALGGLQRELAAVYFEVIWKGLRGPMQKALEALLMQRQMRREVKFPPFIERLIEESALKGFHDGEVKMLRHDIFRVAQRRGLALTTEQQTRIGTCEDRALLDRWFDNVLEAMTGEDVFR